MTDRCDGRYPVPHKREEPFPVTYRCALPMGHDGPHGDGNDRSEPIGEQFDERLQPTGAPDIPAPTSKEKRAFMEGWRHGYYDGGEHDCRMFKPTAERAWQDYLSERRK
jgi:hypothetical protein